MNPKSFDPQTLIALQPIYHSGGNATRLYCGEGCHWDYPYQTKTLLKNIARHYALDLKAQREKLRSRLRLQRALPFCLPENRVFVPFKMLKRVSSNDSSLGYADIAYVQKLVPDGGQALLCLGKSSLEWVQIPLLYSLSAAERSYHTGLQLRQQLGQSTENKNGPSSFETAAKDLLRLLECREDSERLDVIQQDIRELKEMLRSMKTRG